MEPVDGGGAITTYRFANGDTEKIFDSGGAVTTTALDPNTEPDGNPPTGPASGSHGAGQMITPATVSKSAPAPTNMPSAEQTVALLGGSAADQAQFKSYDATDPTVPANAGTVGPGGAVTPDSIHRAHTCAGATYDGGRLHLYMCYDQYIVKEYGFDGSDWYLADRFYGSGTMHDSGFNPDEITGLKQGVHYQHDGNSVYNWTPRQTYDAGHCATETLALTIQGAGYTQSVESCPETWGLYYVSHWTFEEKWDGKGSGPSQGARDTAGIDAVHNPPGATPDRSIIYYVWWE